ncbi:ArnT family glycosyltransferase [Stratiformator vulcanicus]|uniref:Uncharacterized protein n=1 Tax=Stratiformator vulcanicus TaxID=2527980 RepID=A0A517R6Z5_9PLAN|nr:glycosyltransferase family 39 protein [Stratiformator vulcanicus]QDT39603.1 hypothetical protein Pan189_40120 [Stratiformator vulcanicus]
MPRRPKKSAEVQPADQPTWLGLSFARCKGFLSRRRFSLLLSVAVFCVVTLGIDHGGHYPNLPEGPGLTIDEIFNVQEGVRLEVGVRYWLLGAMSLREVFGESEDLGPRAEFGYHLPDHPPLGRYLLGAAHNVTRTLVPPAEVEPPHPFTIAAARVGSAAAFALTVLLVSLYGEIHWGRAAGLCGGLSLALMPRVLGHAHLASLETMIGLAYTAFTLHVAATWRAERGVPGFIAIVTGLLWGLALLTKIQAVLLPIPLTIWALWHWRFRAVRPLVIVAIVGLGTFFVGWPWLWLDPLTHAREYFASAADRQPLHVFYFGRQWNDVSVPWHYPWLMSLVTTPVMLLGLGLLGLVGRISGEGGLRARTDVQWIAAAGLFPLIVFSTAAAVYDGVRLFLISFPLLAVLVGRGTEVFFEWATRQRWPVRLSGALIAVLLLSQTIGIAVMRPVYLSSYNLSIGGIAGAERLGFEVNYWSDAITRSVLTELAENVPGGQKVAVGPVLFPFQLQTLRTQSPVLPADQSIELIEFRPGEPIDADWLVVFERKAELGDAADIASLASEWEPVAVIRRGGVVLGGLFHRKRLIE